MRSNSQFKKKLVLLQNRIETSTDSQLYTNLELELLSLKEYINIILTRVF